MKNQTLKKEPKRMKITLEANVVVKKDSIAIYPRRKKAIECKTTDKNLED